MEGPPEEGLSVSGRRKVGDGLRRSTHHARPYGLQQVARRRVVGHRAGTAGRTCGPGAGAARGLGHLDRVDEVWGRRAAGVPPRDAGRPHHDAGSRRGSARAAPAAHHDVVGAAPARAARRVGRAAGAVGHATAELTVQLHGIE